MAVLFGFLSGMISGLGMGGGTILILCFTLFLKMEQPIAQATNLVFFLPASLSAIFVHRKQIKADKKLIITIAVTGIMGVILGTNLSMKIEVGMLQKGFAIFLLVIAIHEIYELVKMYKNRKRNYTNIKKNKKEEEIR